MKKFTIAKLAQSAGVGVETIRYYERRGLIPKPPRTDSGYRQYISQDVTRVKFIKRAQELGFSLKEISELMSLKMDKATHCGDIKSVAESKISEIDNKVHSLREMKKALKKVVNICPGEGPLTDCPILEVLEIEK